MANKRIQFERAPGWVERAEQIGEAVKVVVAGLGGRARGG